MIRRLWLRFAWLVCAAVASAALVACAGPAPSTPTSVGSLDATGTSLVTTTVATASQPAVALSHLSLTLLPRWRGFSSPVYVTNAGDGSGRLFVVEQGGTVRVIRGGQVAKTPYLDVSALVGSGGERGLLGMAFAPGFKSNGHVYVDYTDVNGDTVIARYTAPDPASDTPAWAAPETVLAIPQPYPNHNGGCLQFGPDGMLWIGMGDGGGAGDPGGRAQNPRALLGKLLRIDAESPAASGKAYALAPGQPVHAEWAPEVWMIGLRNPWRFSFDASTSALWIGDVGQDAWEEIDFLPASTAGLNLGWNVWEGNHPYPPGARPSRTGFTFPLFDYPHPEGECVTGGYVYRGSKYPALVGTYVFGDYIKGWVAAIRRTTPGGAVLPVAEERRMLDTGGQISSFGVDEGGELYLVDYSGTVLAVEASAR